jgi:integrase
MSKADAEFTLFPLIKNIDRLPEGKGEFFHRDRGEGAVTSFALRVRRNPNNGNISNSWTVQFPGGAGARRMTLGSAESGGVTESEARKAARKIRAKVALGQDPQAERLENKEKAKLTLRKLAAEFVESKRGKVKNGTYRMHYHYLLGQHPDAPGRNWRSRKHVDSWLKPLHGRAAGSITNADISAAIKKAEENSGADSAAALKASANQMFSFGLREGTFGLTQNPCTYSREVGRSEPKTRVLTNAELGAIWRNLRDDDYGAVVKLLLLSACRRSEIGNLCWGEIDLVAKKITIPVGRLKNGKARKEPHVIPITAMMRAILDQIPRRVSNDYLFGKEGFRSWSIGKPVLDKAVDIGAWRVHDIRRSVASGMGDLSVPPHVVEAALGHVLPGVAGVYNRSRYWSELCSALELWGTHVAEIIRLSERDETEAEGWVQARAGGVTRAGT